MTYCQPTYTQPTYCLVAEVGKCELQYLNSLNASINEPYIKHSTFLDFHVFTFWQFLPLGRSLVAPTYLYLCVSDLTQFGTKSSFAQFISHSWPASPRGLLGTSCRNNAWKREELTKKRLSYGTSDFALSRLVLFVAGQSYHANSEAPLDDLHVHSSRYV